MKKLLSQASLSIAVGDEGGFAPAINSTDEALGYIAKAIETAGYRPGDEVMIALDAAASEFWIDGKYNLVGEKRHFTTDEMNAMWQELIGRYPIVSIEDPLHEDDWSVSKP